MLLHSDSQYKSYYNNLSKIPLLTAFKCNLMGVNNYIRHRFGQLLYIYYTITRNLWKNIFGDTQLRYNNVRHCWREILLHFLLGHRTSTANQQQFCACCQGFFEKKSKREHLAGNVDRLKAVGLDVNTGCIHRENFENLHARRIHDRGHSSIISHTYLIYKNID